jgi:hydroxymethylbilane synthase
VGTSSRRRAAQLLTLRPDLRIQDLRGNVPTRIRKAQDPIGPYDAIVLAQAGLERLGRQEVISQFLSLEEMLPAPGQGALGIQCRADTISMSMLSPLNHANTLMAVTAERCFLNGLGGGCSLPIAAYASIEAGSLTLLGRVSALDGSRQIDTQSYGSPNEARELGQALAQEALHRGAGRLLEALG